MNAYRSGLMAGVAILASSGASMAMAQTTAPRDQSVLEEIVVTAQKREQSLQDVPISVAAVTAETLQRTNVTSTTALPSLAPALTYSGGYMPGVTSFNIRGIGSYVYRIGIQPAVSVVRDGVPLARPADFVAELGDVQRVEVLSGPQGTLFGKNATGGVINIVRNAPGDELGANIDVTAIRGRLKDNEISIKGAVNVPLTDGVRARLSGFRTDNDDYIKNYHPTARDSGQRHAWGVTGKLAFDITPDVDLLITADKVKVDQVNGSPSIFVPLQQYQQPNIPNIAAKQLALNAPATGQPFAINDFQPFFQNQDLWGVDGDLTWRMGERLRLKVLTSYHEDIVRSQTSFYPGAASPTDPRGFDLLGGGKLTINPNDTSRTTGWNFFNQEVRLEYTGEHLDVTGGVFYSRVREREDIENGSLASATALNLTAQVGTATGPSAAYPYFYTNTFTRAHNDSSSKAAFIDATVHLTDRWDVFGGYRYSRDSLDYDFASVVYTRLPVRLGVNFDLATASPIPGTPFTSTRSFAGDRAGDYWSGRVGTSFNISPEVHLYASLNRSYVGAGVDLSQSSAGTAANPLLALLRPSIARSLEAGVKSELFDRRVRLNAAVFTAKTSDLQIAALVPGTTTNRVQNAGDLKTYGGEFSIEALPFERLALNLGLAYLHTKVANLTGPCYPGQTFANGCSMPAGAGFVQNLAGRKGLNAPTLKGNVAATYNIPLENTFFDMYLRSDFRWQSKVYYQLDHDPFAVQPDYGVLNLAVGFVDHDKRYEARIFVNNVTNRYFCYNMVNGPLARQSCQPSPVDAQRRVGVSISARM